MVFDLCKLVKSWKGQVGKKLGMLSCKWLIFTWSQGSQTSSLKSGYMESWRVGFSILNFTYDLPERMTSHENMDDPQIRKSTPR